ncbi:MAG: glycosyltransferase 87 family protein [Arenicellales bacterium]|nr:glycosyltransferase 87 family protein [Arenicellales bacterium]
MPYRPTIRTVIGALVVSVIAAFYFYLTWHTEYVDFLSDSAIYLLMASYFGNSEAIPAQVFDVVLNDYHLPPMFPIVLWLFGGGAEYPTASYIINTVTVVAAIVCYLAWLESEGVKWNVTVALTCTFAVLPVSLFFANFIVSEYLYIALVFLSLITIQKSSSDSRLILLAAICIGITIMVRSIGICLLPVLLMALPKHTKKKAFLSMCIVVIIPALWHVYKLQFDASNYISSFFESHGDHLITSVVTYAKINLHVLGLSWIKSFDHYLGAPSYFMASTIAFVVAIGWGRRLLQRKPEAIYIVFYLFVIVPWPHPHHMQRFLLPLMPFFLFYGLEGSKFLLGKAGKGNYKKFALPCYLAAIAVLVLPTDLRLIGRLFTPLPAELANFSRSQAWLFSFDQRAAFKNIQISRSIHQSIANTSAVPPSECIWSIDAKRHMLLSKRVSYDTPSPALNKREFEQASKKCNYYFAMRAVPYPNNSHYTSLYPIERVKQQVKIVQQNKSNKFGIISLLLKADGEQGKS